MGVVSNKSGENNFIAAYRLLFDHFGSQQWWPADTQFEVIVGAVLTQNTNWKNVANALDNLRKAGLLEYSSLSSLTPEQIAQYIRPSGYFNLKAKRLRNLFDMIEERYDGELQNFFADDKEAIRENLLKVKGIGPETADSILLYACSAPVFVIDTYTHRVFSRHNMVDEETDYQTMQETFMDYLPGDVQLFNEYHALIVRVAGTYCKKKEPLCRHCPLQGLNQ